jgi:hypothetical protein
MTFDMMMCAVCYGYCRVSDYLINAEYLFPNLYISSVAVIGFGFDGKLIDGKGRDEKHSTL